MKVEVVVNELATLFELVVFEDKVATNGKKGCPCSGTARIELPVIVRQLLEVLKQTQVEVTLWGGSACILDGGIVGGCESRLAWSKLYSAISSVVQR